MLGIVDLGQQLQQVDAGGADAQQRAVLVQRLHQAPVATATVDPLQALAWRRRSWPRTSIAMTRQ